MSIIAIQIYHFYASEWQKIKTKSFAISELTRDPPIITSSDCYIGIAESLLEQGGIKLGFLKPLLRLIGVRVHYPFQDQLGQLRILYPNDTEEYPIFITVHRENGSPLEIRRDQCQYKIDGKEIDINLSSLLYEINKERRPMRIINDDGYLTGLSTVINPGISFSNQLDALLCVILTLEQGTGSSTSGSRRTRNPLSSIGQSLLNRLRSLTLLGFQAPPVDDSIHQSMPQWISTLVGKPLGCSSLMFSVNDLPCEISGPRLSALLTLSDFYLIDPNSRLIGKIDEIQAILCSDFVCYKPRGQDILHLAKRGAVDPQDFTPFTPDVNGFFHVGRLERGELIVDYDILSLGKGYMVQMLFDLIQNVKSFYIDYLAKPRFSTVTQALGGHTFFDSLGLLKDIDLVEALEKIVERLEDEAGNNSSLLSIVKLYRENQYWRLREILGQACNASNMVAVINPRLLLHGQVTQFRAVACMKGETWVNSSITKIKESSKILLWESGQREPEHVALEIESKGYRKTIYKPTSPIFFFKPENTLDEVWAFESINEAKCWVYDHLSTFKMEHYISTPSDDSSRTYCEGKWVLGPNFQDGNQSDTLD